MKRVVRFLSPWLILAWLTSSSFAGILSFYDFNEGSGTTAVDVFGPNNGTITGAAYTVNAGGVSGALGDYALSFDGTGDSVAIANAMLGAFNSITTNNRVTVSYWSFGNAANPRQQVSFEGRAANSQRIVLAHVPWDNNTVYWDAGADNDCCSSPTKRISVALAESNFEGSWANWTFVKDGVADTSQIYRNGVLVASTSGSTSNLGVITSFAIGSDPTGGQSYFGLMDNFQIYNSALNQHQVSFLASSPGSFSLDNVATIDLVSTTGPINGTPTETTLPASGGGVFGRDTLVIAEDLAGTSQAQMLIRVVGVTGPQQIAISKEVTNDSGDAWLEFGVEIMENPSVSSPQGDPTFVSAQENPANDNFATVDLDPQSVAFLDGTLAAGDLGVFTFAINIPGANTTFNGIPSYEFLLIQQAIAVPEASPRALWMLVGLGLAVFAHRYICRKK